MTKKTLEDFEVMDFSESGGGIGYGTLQEVFDKCEFSDEEKENVVQIISEVPFFKYLYQKKLLMVGSRFRKQYEDIVTSSLDKFKAQLSKYYNEPKVIGIAEYLIDRLKYAELEKYACNSIADDYRMDMFDALKDTVKVSLELFPEVNVVEKRIIRKDIIGRADGYIPKEKLIQICPFNFPNTNVPPRNNPKSLLQHEIAHAIDSLDGFQSAFYLKNVFQGFYPSDKSDLKEAELALRAAANFCDYKITQYSGYNFNNILKDNEFNLVAATYEYLSFHIQHLCEILDLSGSFEDFQTNYTKYTDEVIKKQGLVGNYKAQLFALDAQNYYTKNYTKKLKESAFSDKTGEIMDFTQKFFDQKIDVVLGKISLEIESSKREKMIKECSEVNEDRVKEMQKKFENDIKESYKKSLKNKLYNQDDAYFDVDKDYIKDEWFKNLFPEASKLMPDVPGKFYAKIMDKIAPNNLKTIGEELDKIITQTINEIVTEHNEKIKKTRADLKANKDTGGGNTEEERNEELLKKLAEDTDAGAGTSSEVSAEKRTNEKIIEDLKEKVSKLNEPTYLSDLSLRDQLTLEIEKLIKEAKQKEINVEGFEKQFAEATGLEDDRMGGVEDLSHTENRDLVERGGESSEHIESAGAHRI